MATRTRSAETGTNSDPFDTYLQLDGTERALVEATAVLTAGTARTKLAAALRNLGLYESGKKPYSGKSLLRVVERLAPQGLISWDGTHARCPATMIERVNRHLAATGRFETVADAVRRAVPLMHHSYRTMFRSAEEAIREIRVATYRRDEPLLAELVDAYGHQFPITAKQPHPLVHISQNPFDGQWLATFPTSIVEGVVVAWLESGLSTLHPVGDLLTFWDEKATRHGEEADAGLAVAAAELHLLRGNFDDARRVAAQFEDLAIAGTLEACVELLIGDTQSALDRFDKVHQALKKQTRKRKIYLPNISGLLYVLALIKAGDGESLKRADALARAGGDDRMNYWRSAYNILREIVALRSGAPVPTQDYGGPAWSYSDDWLCVLLSGLRTAWDERPEQEVTDIAMRNVTTLEDVATAGGYVWLAAEAAEITSRLKDPAAKIGGAHATFRAQSGAVGLVEIIPYQEPWQRALDALLLVRQDKSAGEKKQAAPDTRLVWLVDCGASQQWWQVSPLLQKRSQRGWTKGRPVSLKRLRLEPDTFDCFTPQDQRVCACIEEEVYGRGWGGRYTQTEYMLNAARALRQLVGHPLVFWEDDRDTHVEVVAGQPELVVTEKNGKFRLTFEPPLPHDVYGSETVTIKESERRIKIISVTAEQARVAQILGAAGLKVPAQGGDQVRAAIASLTSLLTVHSDAGLVDAELPSVDADPRPYVHLFPRGEGLRVELLVRPFQGAEMYCRPGQGRETLISEVDGRRQQARRDLEAERRPAAAVLEACPTLQQLDEGREQWAIDDPLDCLEVVTDLQDLKDKDEVVVAWPEGESMKVTAPVSISQFRVSIRSAQDWFSASGKLHVDEDRVLDMRQLLDLVAQTPGRFLPLGDRQFVALTREFRKRLEEVQAYTEPSGKGIRFHPLSAPPLAEVLQQAGSLRADKPWKEHLDRLQAVEQLDPQLPSTFCGELRDYQHDGYRWLQRLANLGAGACLADDMGLGKTVQVLATLIERGNDGSALVVAPTSVCPNWQREAARFAPTLNVTRFGYDNADRQSVIDALGPRDVLITSYALLQQEIEMLAARRFCTIVLDEAQAIKNMGTKRSQAAMALQSDFRIITTGTPIENHLGELWNLFRFINPGLLRSSADFNRRFASPIEKDGDAKARQHLKKLIHPFVLRRTKDQVLEELPPRTEIVLEVEMSAEEAALYESLRQEALERIQDSAQQSKGEGQRHLQILAELMRLRRACCNPKLLLPDWHASQSKLNVFAETLQELLDNRHKVLVFSQFVDHLTILREYLDKQNIAYQYLDGSTPARQRQQRIDAFQAGEGDVFLISLKAGGVGLNLTAADYVIHMDPWWNPAVEDQASDRAHRIGQQRPVTIYRLVTKGTIEERIVELHQRKRDLAQQLLEGADVSGKMSVDELMKILREA